MISIRSLFVCLSIFPTILWGISCEIEFNPYLLEYEKERLTEDLLLPEEHPVYEFFDALFHQTRATESRDAFEAAGFVVIRDYEDRVAAYHPEYPDYILKLFFDITPYRATERLLTRAETARKMRKIIRAFGLKHIAVPETWVYVLPKGAPHSRGEQRQAILLIQERIPILSQGTTEALWRSESTWTKRMVEDLFTLLYRQSLEDDGFENVRFTESRQQIAFYDLEIPTMSIRTSYQNLVQRLPLKMRRHYIELSAKNGVQLHR